MSEALHPTLSDLIPKPIEGLGEQIRSHVGKSGPGFGWGMIESQASESLHKALHDFDLCEQIAHAWVTLKEVRACREASLSAPGQTTVIPLEKHELSLKATPTLHVKFEGASLPDLKLTYVVAAAFERATLSVCDGRLVAAAPGACVFTAALSCGKVPLHAPWTLTTLKLPGELTFSPGWAIP
jgi:hypothetical protein